MQVTEYYIPATQTYSKMEPAFTSCEQGGDYIIPYAWGAKSRVIGECQEQRGDVGQCLGTFHSRDVDTRDTPWGCISTANYSSDVCRAGASSGVAPADPKTTDPVMHMAPPPLQPFSNAHLHTLKGAKSESMKLQPKQFNKDQASDLFMSYDVFDSPYLERGVQRTSDPAGWLSGVSTYNNLIQRAQASTMVANEPWGSCSSFGNYSSAPNASLTSNNTCNSGNCYLGERK